jgi:small subunit ribosomal protein S3
MSHKVYPKAFKKREIGDWLSRGFYQNKFPLYLQEDFWIRKYLSQKLPAGVIQEIEIERTVTLLKVIIKTSRPALVIGRGGRGAEDLKAGIEKILAEKLPLNNSLPKRDIKIEVLEVKNPWMSASLTAQWVAGQLEKRVPFRRVLKMALSKIMSHKEVKGARIAVSGRLNGVEIARSEWLKEGKMPRQTLRSVIDYGFAQAYCTYGVIGVKVWIYKGEQID